VQCALHCYADSTGLFLQHRRQKSAILGVNNQKFCLYGEVATYVYYVVDGLSVQQTQFDRVVCDVADSLTQPLADDQLAVAVDGRRRLRLVTARRGRLGPRRRRRTTGRLLGRAATAAVKRLLLPAHRHNILQVNNSPG